MNRCRKAAIVTAVAAALLVVAPSADAGTEIGNNCLASGYAPDFTLLQLEKAAEGSLPLAAPSAGVVTEWKVNSGLTPILAEKLRVFRPTGQPSEFRTIADSRTEAVLPGANVFHTRISVRAEDRFGAFAASPSGALYCSSTNPADVMGAVHFDAAEGSTQIFTSNPSFQVALSAVVEPDADHDGYGDETQDKCPKGRAYHGKCPRVRLSVIPKAKKLAILLFVTASSEASVRVHGQVGWGSQPAARSLAQRQGSARLVVGLGGGKKHIGKGATTRFRVPLPRLVKNRLDGLRPNKSLKAKLAATATDFAGRTTSKTIFVKLKGRAP